MANSDYLTINGSQINLVTYECTIDRCTPFVRGGIPELSFSRILGKLTALPDPWSGQSVSWSNGSSYPGTVYFAGDVVGYSDRYEPEVGWVREYRALGLRNRADYVPVTDSNTLSDTASYNLPSDDIYAILAREGRTVGQCILDLLSMSENVVALASYGIGNFTSTGSRGAGTAVLTGTTVSSVTLAEAGSGYTVAPTVVLAGGGGTGASYTATVSGGVITGFTQVSAGTGYTSAPTVVISTLPSITVTDLASLSIIPPFRVTFAGERIIQSIESSLQSTYPTYWVHIDTSGNIRFLNTLSFTSNTVTLGGSDVRWLMPSLHRDLSDCYSQLIVRGDLCVSGVTLAVKPWPGSTSTDGGLQEDFTFGSYTTNAAAIAAWNPNDYQQLSLQTGQDQGSCTCSSTTAVVITSQNTSLTLTADQLDQTSTGQHAILTVYCDTIANLQQMFSARVIANTAMTAGGTSTLTLDRALPSTAYNAYRLYALSELGNVVWRRYKVTNSYIAAQMQQFFPYPFAFRNSDGTAATLTTSPVCSVYWSSSGSPPYNQSSIGVQIDPVSGTITTVSPTSLVYGGGVVTPPTDVQVFLPVANGSLEVQSPSAGGYAGTLYTVEGVQRTKTVTVREWRDYSLSANMQAYSDQLFSALCNVVVEGTIGYLGLATTYLAPGQAVGITGNGYTTGYESVALPVASIDIQLNPGPEGTSYVSTLHLSNRQARYTGDVFIRPAVTGQQIGGQGWAANAYSGLSHYLQSGLGGGFAGEVTGAVSDFGSQGAQAVGGFAGDTAGAVGGFGQEGGTAVGGFGQEGAGTLGEMLGDVNPDLADATATAAANNQLGTMELRQKLVLSS
jgi:hypothetical protein